MAASRTVRVSGPAWSELRTLVRTPCRLTRPYVGMRPTTPQKDAGRRMLPPESVPRDAYTIPADVAAADPEELPPENISRFQGFLVMP